MEGRFQFPRGAHGREGPPRSFVPARAFPDHRAPCPPEQQWQSCRVTRRGPHPNTRGGHSGYHSNTSSPSELSFGYSPQYTPPQKCLEDDSQQLGPSRSLRPYTQKARKENLRGRSAHLNEREWNQADYGGEFSQNGPVAEYSISHRDTAKAVQRSSPLSPNPTDVSCSTTRSSSGSRYDSRLSWHAQADSNSTSCRSSGDPVSLTAAGGTPPPPVAEQRETDGGRSLNEDETAVGAAADISGMTEDEVREYAIQLQTLTGVLLSNMRCLYRTARAEIDRKDRRILAQEREIDSLKRMQGRPDNGS